MTFAKGHPKFGGRAKGATNAVTAAERDFIAKLLLKSQGAAAEAMKRLANENPYQFLAIRERLIKYVVPQLQSASMELTTDDAGNVALGRLAAILGNDDRGTDMPEPA